MIVIFAGPTIDPDHVRSVISDAEIRPPAAVGDIYSAAKSGPEAIGLIDGYFNGVPSVWHKEILWALQENIPVFGASSMGALRAAELEAFGMIGIGRIFEAYRDNGLEDDDEVALHHGPAELDYVALSEPMVNIRATLDRAIEEAIVDDGHATTLIQIGKGLYYPERNWDRLFELAPKFDLDSARIDRLRNWLPTGRVDQKRDDAVAMLNAMAGRAARPNQSDRAIEFSHTVMWDRLIRRYDEPESDLTTLLLLDRIRNDPQNYERVRKQAAAKLQLPNQFPTDDQFRRNLADALSRFRAGHGLYTAAAFNKWLAAKGMDQSQLEERLAEELAIDEMIADSPKAFRQLLLDEISSLDDYDKWIAQARAIAQSLSPARLRLTDPSELGLNPIELLFWYFEELLGMAVPQDLDHYCRKNDFTSRAEFDQMMARQYLVWQDRAKRSEPTEG